MGVEVSAHRVSFRGKAADVCYQKQIRDEMAGTPGIDILFPRPDPDDLSLKSARVRSIGRALTWKVISRYEWLGTLPPCSRHYGLFFGDVCGGVAAYGSPCGGPSTAKMLGVDQHAIAYLCRGACVHWAPPGAAPKLINFSARLTGAEVAIAYSDPDAGEIGTVYQAAGWTCIGLGYPERQYVSPHGRVYDHRLAYDLARERGGTSTDWRRRLLAAGWTNQQASAKIRYVSILPKGRENRLLVERVASYAQPYPKRTASDHAAEA